MNYDVPKFQLKPQYVIEKSYREIMEEDCALNDFSKQPAPTAENWGGHISFQNNAVGTAMSSTSLSTVKSETVSFISSDNVNPSLEFVQHHVAHNLEQIINPIKKQKY